MENKSLRRKVNYDYERSESFRRHRRQRGWQILLPIGLGILLVLIIAVLIIITAASGDASGSISVWADTSIIWLVLPVMMFAIGAGLIFFTLIYFLAKVLKVLPSYTYLVRQYADLAAAYVEYWMGKISAPIISIKSFSAGANAFFTHLFGRSRD